MIDFFGYCLVERGGSENYRNFLCEGYYFERQNASVAIFAFRLR